MMSLPLRVPQSIKLLCLIAPRVIWSVTYAISAFAHQFNAYDFQSQTVLQNGTLSLFLPSVVCHLYPYTKWDWFICLVSTELKKFFLSATVRLWLFPTEWIFNF